jgi:hypothetical protein
MTNCQVGVSLTVATRTEQVPIDFALYLPESWTEDRARRQEARIPDDVSFATKTELALQLLRRAVDNGIPPGIVLADQAYGTSREFRKAVREMGLHYGVAVDPRSVVRVFDKLGRRRDEVISIIDLAHRIEAGRIPTMYLARGHQEGSFGAFRAAPCRPGLRSRPRRRRPA